MIDDLALGYVKHNLALLALPVVLGAIALASRPFRWPPFPALARGANSGVNMSQALNVWIIQAVVAIGPPLGAVILPRLHQDRLGHPAVLPDAARADRDSSGAGPENRVVDPDG